MCTSCSCVYTSMYRILFAHFQLPDVHRSDALLRFIAIFWVTEASKCVYLNRFSVSTYTFFCLLHRHGKLTTWNFDDCFMLIIFFYCLFFFFSLTLYYIFYINFLFTAWSLSCFFYARCDIKNSPVCQSPSVYFFSVIFSFSRCLQYINTPVGGKIYT